MHFHDSAQRQLHTYSCIPCFLTISGGMAVCQDSSDPCCFKTDEASERAFGSPIMALSSCFSSGGRGLRKNFGNMDWPCTARKPTAVERAGRSLLDRNWVRNIFYCILNLCTMKDEGSKRVRPTSRQPCFPADSPDSQMSSRSSGLQVLLSGVLSVPPWECAWLTSEEHRVAKGSACLCFEAKGETVCLRGWKGSNAKISICP